MAASRSQASKAFSLYSPSSWNPGSCSPLSTRLPIHGTLIQHFHIMPSFSYLFISFARTDAYQL